MDTSPDAENSPRESALIEPVVENPQDLISSDPLLDARAWPLRLLLVGLVLLVFGRAVGFRFVTIDDNVNVYDNQYLRPVTLDNVLHFWKTPYQYMYIPSTYTFLSIVGAAARREGMIDPLERFDSRLFHAADVILHIAVVLLAFELLRRLTKNNVAACLGAAVFAVHPLQVESVAWVTETKTLLAGVLSLAALLQYVKFCESGGVRWGAYALASLAFVLAVLSKPTASAVPLLAGILALGFYRRSTSTPLVGLTLAPWLLAVGLITWVTKMEQPDSAVGLVVPWYYRPWIALDAVAFYISKLAFPWEMALDYGRNPVYVIAKSWNYFFWLLPVQLGIVLWLLDARREWYIAALLFVAALAPILGFVPFGYQQYSTVADRYAYLAMLGPALAVALLFIEFPRRITLWATCVVVVVLGGLSFAQAGYWRDSETLLSRTLEVNNRSELALLNLSMENFLQDRLDDASAKLKQILDQNPNSPRALHDLGLIYLRKNQNDKAIEQFHRSLSVDPTNVDVINSLAQTLLNQGKPAEAIARLQEALALEPRRAMTLGNLGSAYATSGQLEKATEYYEEALRYDADVPYFHFGLGKTQFFLGRREEALLHFQAAAHLDPKNAQIQYSLGQVLHSMNQFASATEAYRKALALKPGWWEPSAHLAVALCVNPDPKGRNPREALQLAQAACQETKFKEVDAVDALATAKMYNGEVDDAVKFEQQALALAQEQKNTDKIARIQERLNLLLAAQQRNLKPKGSPE